MVEINLSSGNPKKPNSLANRGCGVLFGLAFVAIGCLFTVIVAKEFLTNVGERGWEKAPATLTKAEISVDRDAEPPFRLAVSFDYTFEGRRYKGDRYQRGDTGDDEYEKLALIAKSLRERGELFAHVNPDEPGTAVLKVGSLWMGLLVLFPLVFVAVGAAIMIASIRSARKRGKNGVETISSSPTNAASNAGAWIGVVVGLVFVGLGIGLIYPLAIKPLARAQSAKSWPATPCEVIWARVQSHEGDESTTYSADIFYRYEFGGQQYRSNRYSLVSGSSSGRKKYQAIVDRFKAAENPVCYVDPSLPERAILKNKLGATALLGLIPLVAGGIGAWLLIFALGSRREEKRAKSSPFLPSDGTAAGRKLTPGKSRLGAVVGLLVVGLFWNGITFGLLFPEAWLEGGEGGTFLKLFSIPFMLIGIGIVVGFLYSLIVFFNPKPILALIPGEPMLGQETSLTWRIKGNARRIRRLRVVLKGIEKATFERGTDSVTVESVFYATALTDLSDPSEMYQGDTTFTVPDDLMHSFDAGNNEIVWRLEVKGELPRWPNIGDKFDIEVHPPEQA